MTIFIFSHRSTMIIYLYFIRAWFYQQTHKLGLKRYIAMQSDGDIVVSIRCSIHSVYISVRYGSNIIAHILYDNTVSDRPMKLKIAKSARANRLFSIKLVQLIILVMLKLNIPSMESNRCFFVCLFILFIVAWAIFQLSGDCWCNKHMKSKYDKEFGTSYCKFASNRKSSNRDHCIENRIESKRYCIVAALGG